MNNCFNIFYHNEQKLANVLDKSLFSREYNFVNLNELDLPETLQVKGVNENINKALFSEYLGILSLRPQAEMIGCFTYSIQSKFSARWALESGNDSFLPRITFDELAALNFERDFLYGVEFTNPSHLIPKQMGSLYKAFPLTTLPETGPFKGSFVVKKSTFENLQKWLFKVARWLIHEFKTDEISNIDSPFDRSASFPRSMAERRIDALRHTYGTVLERAVAYFLGAEFDECERLLIGNMLDKKRKSMDFESQCLGFSDHNNLAIAFGNSAYQKVAEAWLGRVQGQNIKNYAFISLDKNLHQTLTEKKYNSVYLDYKGNLKDFWVFRLKTIYRLLQIGLNVVHSDADAFWLENPLPDCESDDADILSSQGTIYPQSTLQNWGFVLCCGFQRFRSTKRTLAFFEELIPEVEKAKDDQVAINELLVKHETQWDNTHSPSYDLAFNNTTFRCFKKSVFGRTKWGMTLRLLPHAEYQRFYEGIHPNVKVLHLLSDKTQEAKLSRLSEVEKALQTLDMNGGNEVIWLASYPRSGNTLLRTIFKHNFGIKTYSLYNDKADIGNIPELREFVGHEDGNWGVVSDGYSQVPSHDEEILKLRTDAPVVIKTHSQYCEYYADKKVIYIVRDMRPVLSSYLNYKQKFTKNNKSDSANLNELVFDGDELFGHWSDHVGGWLSGKTDNVLLLRYEDILLDFPSALSKISHFIGLRPIEKELRDFNDYQKINKDFFNKGMRSSWEEMLPIDMQKAILHSSSLVMESFDYKPEVYPNNTTSITCVGPKCSGRWAYVCSPVLDVADTIDRTIISVITQEGDFFLHYHIQDGGSKDGTLEKIYDWQRLIKENHYIVGCKNVLLTVCSTPDEGMYDALRKGIEYMQPVDNGIVTYINGDDILFPGAISTACKVFKEIRQAQWLVPPSYTIDASGSHRGHMRGPHPSIPNDIAQGKCNGVERPFIQQEGVFWLSQLWNKVGGVDPTLKYAGDWDLWRRFSHVEPPVYLDYHLGAFRKRLGQLSQGLEGYREEIETLQASEKLTHENEASPEKVVVNLKEENHYSILVLDNKESEQTADYARIKLDSSVKAYLNRYLKTKLNSFLIEAARLHIKSIASVSKQEEIIALIKNQEFNKLCDTLRAADDGR